MCRLVCRTQQDHQVAEHACKWSSLLVATVFDGGSHAGGGNNSRVPGPAVTGSIGKVLLVSRLTFVYLSGSDVRPRLGRIEDAAGTPVTGLAPSAHGLRVAKVQLGRLVHRDLS